MNPTVADLYHGDTVVGQADGSYSGFAKLKAAGYVGVILVSWPFIQIPAGK